MSSAPTPVRRLAALSAAATIACAFGCAGGPPEAPKKALDELRHVRWSPRIGQGAEPRSEADFLALAEGGYAVILSVDGAATNVEAAQRHGLRYVHVPIGYDRIDRQQAVAIVKAVASAEGPVYVHCHHGRHRGPAAAALARVALDAVSPDRAVEDLLRTLSPSYPGLRQTVERFVPPQADELAQVGEPPSRVRPSDLVEHMLEIDDRWDHVKTVREADWQADPQHPDLDPANEAKLLAEAFTETARLQEWEGEQAAADFQQQLRDAGLAADALERALRSADAEGAEAAYQLVSRACSACHESYRN
jgi:hypothetical protein